MAATKKPKKWRNRIVGHADVPPGDLMANPRNWRLHPLLQENALSAVLADVGWIDEVIVNKRTGFVLDGHLRVALAQKRHETSVPVKYVDLTDDEEGRVLAVFDPIGSLAGVDTDKMDALLADIGEQDASLQLMLDRVAGKLTEVTVEEIWKFMPEFVNEKNMNSLHSVIVHFEDEKSVAEFAKAVAQPVTMKTRAIWYPRKLKENLKRFTT